MDFEFIIGRRLSSGTFWQYRKTLPSIENVDRRAKNILTGKNLTLNNYPATIIEKETIEDKSLGVGFSFLRSAGLAYHLNNRFDLLTNLEHADAFPASPTYIRKQSAMVFIYR